MKRKKAPKRQTTAEPVQQSATRSAWNSTRRHDAEIVSIVVDTKAKTPCVHCTLRMADGSEVVVALKTLDLDRSGTSLDPSGVSFVDKHGNLRGVS